MEASVFVLKKILAQLLLPPVLPLLFVLVGLVWRRMFAWVGLVLALALATPATVRLLSAPLEDTPTLSSVGHAQAIVILGADRTFSAPEYGGATVGRLSLERVRYGARLAKMSGLPVLVTGGSPGGAAPEAQLMRAVLTEEFGVPVRWVEDHSRDTHENAQFSAAMLREAGLQRVVLVTHALHMKRAVKEFEAAGLSVRAAPMGRFSSIGHAAATGQWLPNANAAYFGWFALHEWLGNLAQAVRVD